jgi:hypothetical protein
MIAAVKKFISLLRESTVDDPGWTGFRSQLCRVLKGLKLGWGRLPSNGGLQDPLGQLAEHAWVWGASILPGNGAFIFCQLDGHTYLTCQGSFCLKNSILNYLCNED